MMAMTCKEVEMMGQKYGEENEFIKENSPLPFSQSQWTQMVSISWYIIPLSSFRYNFFLKVTKRFLQKVSFSSDLLFFQIYVFEKQWY